MYNARSGNGRSTWVWRDKDERRGAPQWLNSA